MAEDTEENKYPFISESVYGNYYNISAAVQENPKPFGEGTLYRVSLNEDNGCFIGVCYNNDGQLSTLVASGNFVYNETERRFFAENWEETNITELVKIKLNTVYKGGTRPFWHLNCEEVECLARTMTPKNVQSTVNFIPTYEEISSILKGESDNSLFGGKDFFITALYIPPKTEGDTGHFVTGIVHHKDGKQHSPCELFVYDTDNDREEVGEFILEDGRVIEYKHLNKYTNKGLTLQGKSNLCGVFTAKAISLMATCENFAQIKKSCEMGEFQQQNYNDVQSYLRDSVELSLDCLVTNGVAIEEIPTQGYGAGRGFAAQTISKSSQPNISKTTDDIIQKGSQQTHVERLQQQRRRASSLPSNNKPMVPFG